MNPHPQNLPHFFILRHKKENISSCTFFLFKCLFVPLNVSLFCQALLRERTYYHVLSMNLCVCSIRTIKLHFGHIRERRGLVSKMSLKEENANSNQISTSFYPSFFIRRQMKMCVCLCANVRARRQRRSSFILGSCWNCFCQEYSQPFQLVAQAFSGSAAWMCARLAWTKVLIQALAHTAVCGGWGGVRSHSLCTRCSSGRPDGVFLHRLGQFIHPSLQWADTNTHLGALSCISYRAPEQHGNCRGISLNQKVGGGCCLEHGGNHCKFFFV